jgi:hypothetical protein
MSDEPPGLSLQRPLRPSAVVPDFLHRGSDGWVPLARQVGGQWQELGSVAAADLRGLFADQVIAEAVQNDGYFGLHAMYRPAPYRTKHTLPGLQPTLRNLQSIRYLNCCHVDLDGYKHGLDTQDMIAAVMQMVDGGKLPPPSLFTVSRGVWVMWRLHDRLNPERPLYSYPDSVVSRWCKVQKALHMACAAIGSDVAAGHAATLTRIPGSLNSKHGRRVGYSLKSGTDHRPVSYTLDELEAVMRPYIPVPARPPATPVRPKSRNPVYSKRALQGWYGRWHRMLRLLGQLRDMRGGWKVGTRSFALFYVAMSLRALGSAEDRVKKVMARHLDGMDQPIGDTLKLSDALRVFRNLKRIRGRGATLQPVADALNVSPEEAAVLSADRKKPFPPASRYRIAVLPEPEAVPRAVSIARRRETVKWICDRIKADGRVPDGAEVEAVLLSQGMSAARTTVLSDMKAIGHPSGRSHRPRQRAFAGDHRCRPDARADSQAQPSCGKSNSNRKLV